MLWAPYNSSYTYKTHYQLFEAEKESIQHRDTKNFEPGDQERLASNNLISNVTILRHDWYCLWLNPLRNSKIYIHFSQEKN